MQTMFDNISRGGGDGWGGVIACSSDQRETSTRSPLEHFEYNIVCCLSEEAADSHLST